MQNKRSILIIISVICIIIGGVGLISTFQFLSNKVIISSKEEPMYFVGKTAIDHNGLIYFTLNEYSSIQVYEKEGNFKYRIIIPTNSIAIEDKFQWIFDEAGKIHIIDLYGRYIILDGVTVVSDEQIEASEAAALFDNYKEMAQNSYVDQDGNQYKVIGKTIKKYDAQGNYINNIRPNAPMFPLPMPVFLVLLAAGLVGIWVFGLSFRLNRLRGWWKSDLFR